MRLLYIGKKDEIFEAIEEILKQQDYDFIEFKEIDLLNHNEVKIFDNLSNNKENIIFILEDINIANELFARLNISGEVGTFYKLFNAYIFNKLELNFLRDINTNIKEIEGNFGKSYFTFLQDESKERTIHELNNLKSYLVDSIAANIKMIDVQKIDKKQGDNPQPKSNNFKQKEHLTYYKKYKLNKDVSIRYFYIFEDRKDLEKKWVLKSHSQKKLIKLDKNVAQKMLEIFGVDKYIEIRGKCVDNGDYEKIIIKPNGKIKRIIESNQEKANKI